MLSSAKKSVPTLKQFIQPYFIEIAPDGAITAACPRFVTILEILDAEFDTSLSRTKIPRSIHLSVNRPGSRSFLIRWTSTPANEPMENGWQFTSVMIHTNLVKYVSDIILSTDTQFQIMPWNKAAEKCYGISARHAIGKNFRELISYEYVNSTQKEAERLFLERGYWKGEIVYLSPNGKKSYLLCSVRTMRDNREKVIGIVAVIKDITDINFRLN